MSLLLFIVTFVMTGVGIIVGFGVWFMSMSMWERITDPAEGKPTRVAIALMLFATLAVITSVLVLSIFSHGINSVICFLISAAIWSAVFWPKRK
jgi:hypothetical protein